MIRTFETRIGKEQDGLAPVLDLFADLMGKAERLAHAHLMAGKPWIAESFKHIYRDLELTATLMRSVKTSLDGKRKAVEELNAKHVETLRKQVSAKAKDVAGKEADRTKLVLRRNQAMVKIPLIQAKVEKQKSLLDKPAKRDKARVALKKHLESLDKVSHHLTEIRKKVDDIDFALHQGKRKLGILGRDVILFEARKGNPSLAFGSKKTFNAQHHLADNGYPDHAAWLKDWQNSRSNQFLLVGATIPKSGNDVAKLQKREDGQFDMELRLPPALARYASTSIKVRGYVISSIRFTSLHFSHGHEVISNTLKANRPITYRFIRDKISWKILVTVDDGIENPQACWSKGALGVDLNVGHVALTMASADGNPLWTRNIPLVLEGLTSDQRLDLIRKACSELAKIAQDAEVPIVSESLDFADKKDQLGQRGKGARYARMLSSFAYSSFDAALHGACLRLKVHHRRVNPAYTSVIGLLKFARRYGLSVHASAALAIARRAMRHSERVPHQQDGTVSVPLRGGVQNALPPPARIGGLSKDGKPLKGDRHVWSSWSRICRGRKTAFVAQGRAGQQLRSDLRRSAGSDLCEAPGSG